MKSVWTKFRHPSWRLGLAAGAALVWLVVGAPYVNWAPIVPPLDQHQLTIRNDGKGSGEFGSPRSGNRQHRGVDIAAPIGTPVRAIRSGLVAEAGMHHGFGRYVKIEHGGQLHSLYGHLNTITVRAGQRVRQGQVIGTVGKTGNARSPIIKPHLHIEIVRGEMPVDPEHFGLVLVRLDAPAEHGDADGGE